ncbi:MAG TPA: protease pro-enzyme activation domain-containing protein [Acidimicrobiales bacterium]|nr:protease pro-enzyme activation domain-containing protein [Acidimicrobiales bacterium]
MAPEQRRREPRRPARRRAWRAVAGLAAATCAPLAPAGVARAAPPGPPAFVRLGPSPLVPRSARLLGPAAGSAEVSFEVVLAPRHRRKLAALVRAVTDPASPAYRRFLRPGEFAARFAPGRAEVAAVEQGLRRLGLEATGLDADHLGIEVRASAAAAAAALATPLERYRLASGAVVVAPRRAPRLPRQLGADVQAILGLDGLAAEVPVGLSPRRAPLPPASRTPHDTVGPVPTSGCAPDASQAGYTPDQIAAAYGFTGLYGAGDLGSGVTVALAEFAPYSPSDLAAYAACFGGTVVPSVTAVPVDGGPGSYDLSSEVETELDLEDVVGLVPEGRVLVYEGPNDNGVVSDQAAYDTYAAIVAADRAQVISTSWGACEADVGSRAIDAENVLFEQAALQGETVVAASGDNGSSDCGASRHASGGAALAVDDPASQPYVTGVGGTTLVLSPRSETVWNTGATGASDEGASGGGLSAHWAMPAYQADAPPSLGVVGPSSTADPCHAASGLCREVPDVSADAGAPYAIYCTMGDLLCSGDGWTPLGGTSAAAPTVAALFALADASSACAGRPVGFANPALYKIAGGAWSSLAFTDVTSGTNDLTGANGGRYEAGPGYDLASGLGTPIAGNGADGGLVAQLCAGNLLAATSASLPRPLVSKVSPTTARSRGGARVVVTGSRFYGVTAVHFGAAVARSFSVLSPTRLVATVPAGRGSVHVTVTDPAGTSRPTRDDVFRYLAVPQVRRVVPAAGPGAGGTRVVVVGQDFDGVVAVYFGDRPATGVRLLSPTRLAVVTPPGAGRVRVAVRARGGTSPPGHAAAFAYR